MANTVKIELRCPQPPDCCARCPLIGIIPDDYKQRGVRQSYCCLGVHPHEPLTSKGIVVSVSAKKEKTGHIHHRPCEDKWEVWYTNPGHMVTISKESYRLCRLPYESRQQLAFNFSSRKRK